MRSEVASFRRKTGHQHQRKKKIQERERDALECPRARSFIKFSKGVDIFAMEKNDARRELLRMQCHRAF